VVANKEVRQVQEILLAPENRTTRLRFTGRGLVHFSGDQLDLADTLWPKTST